MGRCFLKKAPPQTPPQKLLNDIPIKNSHFKKVLNGGAICRRSSYKSRDFSLKSPPKKSPK
jgi:hypothetical protein